METVAGVEAPAGGAPAGDGGTSASSGPGKLSDLARAVLVVLGVALAIAGGYFWFSPVQHSKPAPASAKCTDAKTCWVKVDDAPQILLSTIVVLGALLALVGLNGRVITKFSVAGASFESAADSAAKKAEDKTKAAVEQDPAIDTQKADPVIPSLASASARASALQLERIYGRPLTMLEADDVAAQASRQAVDSARGNPAFQ